jgi:hypothetical protein
MRSLCLALGLTMLVAAPAGAATLSFTPARFYAAPEDYPSCPDKVPDCGPPPNQAAQITVTDTAGAADDLLVERSAKPDPGYDSYPGEVTLHDSAGLTLDGTSASCTQVDAATVRCASNHPKLGITVKADLGGGNDRARGAPESFLSIVGGPGNDDLVGWDLEGDAGHDTLAGQYVDGDAGADRIGAAVTYGAILDGGPGPDLVLGGPGDDTIRSTGGPPGSADIIDGGPGTDEISYDGSNRPVIVDLAGRTATTDVVRHVENIVGSGGRDILRGDDRSNEIGPGYGNGPMLVDGRGGGDVLTSDGAAGEFIGGPGDDDIDVAEAGWAKVSGGPGRDLVRVSADEMPSCGAGLDRVTGPDLRPVLLAAPDCEAFGQVARVDQRQVRSLAVRVSCTPAGAGVRRCRASIEAQTAAGTPIGSAERIVAPGTVRSLRVKLTRRVGVAVLRIRRTSEWRAGGHRTDERTLRVPLTN